MPFSYMLVYYIFSLYILYSLNIVGKVMLKLIVLILKQEIGTIISLFNLTNI